MEEKREGEKKKKRKRKRRRREAKQKGMETNLEYGIVWSYGILRLCMVNSLSPNLGFLYNCILTLDFWKLGLVKPTRNKMSMKSPFEVGFMVNDK